MIFPQHKTHAGYLVCISDLGGEPQGNGSARILYETNTELKRRIYDNTIVIYIYCDVRHPPSTKAGFNMNLIAVLNINQSAYEPKKLTQRRSMVRWQKNITSQTAKKIWSCLLLVTPAQPPFSERKNNTKQMLAISTATLNMTYETFCIGIPTIFSRKRKNKNEAETNKRHERSLHFLRETATQNKC